jgi:hypothetical protein
MRRTQRLGSDKTGWATTVWIDPGGTTGWGVIAVDPSILTENKPINPHSVAHWACGELTGNMNQQASQVLELFDLWDDAAVGIERFHVRQLAVELSPVAITEKVEYGLWLMEKWQAEEEERPVGRPRLMFKQEPSLAKRTLTDDMMRELGFWVPGKDHKRDAIKHCYTFLQRMQEKPQARAAAWPSLFRVEGRTKAVRPPTSKRSKY